MWGVAIMTPLAFYPSFFFLFFHLGYESIWLLKYASYQYMRTGLVLAFAWRKEKVCRGVVSDMLT